MKTPSQREALQILRKYYYNEDDEIFLNKQLIHKYKNEILTNKNLI